MKYDGTDVIYMQYMETILKLEEVKCIEQALQMFDLMFLEFPGNEEQIFFERAKLNFRNGNDRNALFDFIQSYNYSQNYEICDLILQAYYEPNRFELQKKYENNFLSMENYSLYRNNEYHIKPEVIPLWHDEEITIFFWTKEKQFQTIYNNKIELKKNDDEDTVYSIVNIIWMDVLVAWEAKTRRKNNDLEMENPIYYVFDQCYWEIITQLYDVSVLLKNQRVVFLIGKNSFYNYFFEFGTIYPNRMIELNSKDSYKKQFEILIKEQENEIIVIREELNNYYQKQKIKILERIRQGKPRFLFSTSRFTTALQYHIRDCMESVKQMGCNVTLLIEPLKISRIRQYDWIKFFLKFKPDILFVIDHFRFEYEDFYIPDEVIFITWIQDVLLHIMDPRTPGKLKENDFIMQHFVTWTKMKEVGYPVEKTIFAPITANEKIYKLYTLSAEEKEKYSTDLCMICHNSDLDGNIKKILNEVANSHVEKTMLRQLLYEYSEQMIFKGRMLYRQSEIEEYINDYIEKKYQIVFLEKFVQYLAQRIWHDVNQSGYRQALADWLIEAGYQNIKLWGNGWLNSPKYIQYAAGPAKNGATLSKILQSSKIVIGNNCIATASARVWETMLSGAFYLSNDIPEDVDANNIRTILIENEEVEIFSGKDDLLKKVEYYLSHEEERIKMIKNGHKAATEKMTYTALMKKVVSFLQEYYENNDDWK